MFELKYKITDGDIKAVNKKVMWKYFIPYLSVSLLGLAVGIAATVLRPRVDLLVLGIILIVLGSLLLACSILLAIAPKTFVVSALLTSDDVERTVKIDGNGITVQTENQTDIIFASGEISKLVKYNNGLLAYVGKERVLLIKDAFTDQHTVDELYEFLKNRSAVSNATESAASVEENAVNTAAEDSAEASRETGEAENVTPEKTE